jgi:adenosylcobinamide-GDP ribazoletransferase
MADRRFDIGTDPAGWLADLQVALGFLTRLPVGAVGSLGNAAWTFPLVGLIVGVIAALVFWIARGLSLPHEVAALLAVGTAIALTGALHEDGLADAADGLGGAHGGKRALEIMKDSRIGSYGALALGFSLLLRAGALAELAREDWVVLLEIHCLARLGPVWLMHAVPYAGDLERSKHASLFPAGHGQIGVAIGWGVAGSALGALAGGLTWATTAVLWAVLGTLSWCCAGYFRRAVGGVTGDLLGALEQVAEIAAWLTWLICHAARL